MEGVNMRQDYDKPPETRAQQQGYQAMAGQMVGAISGACRQSAKGYLQDKVQRLRREADQLEALSGALPEKLPLDADSALWALLCRS